MKPRFNFVVGQKVFGPHGKGEIVALNGNQGLQLTSRNLDMIEDAVVSGLGKAVIDSMYDAERYPYVVLFANGYKDFYGPGSLLPISQTLDVFETNDPPIRARLGLRPKPEAKCVCSVSVTDGHDEPCTEEDIVFGSDGIPEFRFVGEFITHDMMYKAVGALGCTGEISYL